MPDRRFKRPAHRVVLDVLRALDAAFLSKTRCFFGGGTRIVLELGEYRESRDIDFLCADRDGYRMLRETVTEKSLGDMAGPAIRLAREVRADQYGVRTFLAIDDARLKFEIIREAGISLEGAEVPGLPVLCLGRRHCFAEKFLANADRGLDASTLSRDLVDLAFMMDAWPEEAENGRMLAESAYGASVMRSLRSALQKLQGDRAYRNRCVEGLALSDTKTLNAGIKALAAFAAR